MYSDRYYEDYLDDEKCHQYCVKSCNRIKKTLVKKIKKEKKDGNKI